MVGKVICFASAGGRVYKTHLQQLHLAFKAHGVFNYLKTLRLLVGSLNSAVCQINPSGRLLSANLGSI